MKAKIIGILMMMLVLTAGVINAVPENSVETTSNLSEIVMFLQEPESPENEPLSAMSDTNEPWRAYEDFWGITLPICEVRWWGIAAKRVGDKMIPSDPEDSVFTITIYEDDGTGKPGDIVCNYENVMPIISGTGIMYEFPSLPEMEGIFELYYYEAVLSSSCNLSEGWISIVKTDSVHDLIGGIICSKDGNDNMCFYNTNTHQWSFYDEDLSFALIAYIDDLSCDGLLGWSNVAPGDTKTGTIYVKNIGTPNSLLDWRIESDISWGNWTFSPDFGVGLKPEDGPLAITVTVIAPDEKNKEFFGEIKLVNENDLEDTCSIPVTLITPKTKTMKSPFQQLFDRFPNAFPILKQILELL
jgi:hypothetical protein